MLLEQQLTNNAHQVITNDLNRKTEPNFGV